jgi:hypothetical protein
MTIVEIMLRGARTGGHAKGGAGLLPPPALGERYHRSLACRLVAKDRRAVFVLAIGQRPQPWRAYGRGDSLHDAGDNYAFGKHVIIAPRAVIAACVRT